MDESESFSRVAFTLSEESENYDFSRPPMTGEEYLRYVMRESSQCKKVVKADINVEKLKKTSTNVALTQSKDEDIVTPSNLLPSLEWQQFQIYEFSQLRKRINYLQQKAPPSCTVQLPTLRRDTWKEFYMNNSPLLSTILSISQPDLNDILDYFAYWIQIVNPDTSISRQMSTWLYAIFSCIVTPLLPNACSSMRQIARKCLILRSQLVPEMQTEEIVVPLNLIICLVARYFNQTDLAD